MIRTFHDIDGDPVTFHADRRMVGAELYVIFTPNETSPETFDRATSSIRAAVLTHLLLFPQDKYLARFIAGENIGTEEERWHEVQFKDRDDLRFPRWQQMIVSPWLNSREAA